MSASIHYCARRKGHAFVEVALVLVATLGIFVVTLSSVGKATKNLFSDAGLALNRATHADGDRSAQFDSKNEFELVDPTGWRMLAITCFTVVAAVALMSRLKLGKRNKLLHPQEFVLANQICPNTRKKIFAKRDEIMTVLTKQLGVNSYDTMQVGHLMSRKVRSVSPNTPVAKVRQLFKELECRHLLVLDEGNCLVGIISDRDLRRSCDGAARNLMTVQPVCASPEMHLGPVITLMMDRRISCVPVIENDLVVGVLTTTDLMIALQCTIRLFHSLCEPEHHYDSAAEQASSSVQVGGQ